MHTKQAEQETVTRIRLPLHRVSWAHIDTPEEVTDEKTGKKKLIYRYTAWIPGDADMSAAQELFKVTKEAKWAKGVPAHKKATFITPYRRANEDDYAKSPQLLEMRDNAGGKDPFICNLKSHGRAPGLRKLAPGNQKVACDEGDFYSGCWAVCTVNAYAYDNRSMGVAFSLQNILKIRDDSPLGGGGISADVEFADDKAEDYGITENELLLGGLDESDDLEI